MFGDNEINIPLVTDKINNKLPFQPTLGFSWEELQTRGYIKETIEEGDDIVTITKEFVSIDETFKKTESITMSSSEWEKVKLGLLKPEEKRKQIQKLEALMLDCQKNHEYEKCAIIRDKLKILKDSY